MGSQECRAQSDLPVFVHSNRSKERRKTLEHLKAFIDEEEGVGVVEIILILVVLISLVLIFKKQLTSLVNSIFKKIVSQSDSV